ncbi:MAG: hypothetical protein HY369_02245 [Candidatus Aenigmarchaeota archaeon]|nr:hypothetical protein [Candidatus Aenigmarchaeota archaeon]
MDRDIEQDFMIEIEAEDCDYYQMPEGLLLVGRCDPFASQGFLDLNPNATLPKRARQAPGMFKQMAGSSVIRIEEAGKEREQTLQTGDKVTIPANAGYTITNPSVGKCVLSWKFTGDVQEAFTQLRKQLPLVTPPAREKSGYKELFAEHMKRRQDADAQIHGNY